MRLLIFKVFMPVFIAVMLVTGLIFAQDIKTKQLPTLTVDAAQSLGEFKPLNGVNGGPRIRLGNYFDNSEYFEAFDPPFIRLHDCPYADLGTVDIHAIFPDFSADETNPANYTFEKTDHYIKPIIELGAKVIYRLGESIEHGEPKYWVHPPPDFKKWARICQNIVRHYNMGWADGYEWDIRHWEIWNEPDIYNCWTGTMEQYCQLYREAATALKELDPALKVGGPALARSLDSDNGKLFLGFCRDNQVPLDFVSWHGYANHPDKLIKKIETGIVTLTNYGFDNVETQFTEWNYAAPGAWGKDREKSRQGFLNVAGGPGAAFAASMLAFLQNTQLDIACFYSAFGTIFRFGFFDRYGVPSKQYYTFKAFNKVVECGTRIAVTGNNRETGVGITAAKDENTGKTAVLLSNFQDDASRFTLNIKNVPLTGQIVCSEYVIDDERSLTRDREQLLSSGNFSITIELPMSSVCLILLESK